MLKQSFIVVFIFLFAVFAGCSVKQPNDNGNDTNGPPYENDNGNNDNGNNDNGNNDSNPYDRQLRLTHWNQVENVEHEGIWLIYVYQPLCFYCVEIKDYVIAFADDHLETHPMYFVDLVPGFGGSPPGPGVPGVPTLIVMEGQMYIEQQVGSEIVFLLASISDGTYEKPE